MIRSVADPGGGGHCPPPPFFRLIIYSYLRNIAFLKLQFEVTATKKASALRAGAVADTWSGGGGGVMYRRFNSMKVNSLLTKQL